MATYRSSWSVSSSRTRCSTGATDCSTRARCTSSIRYGFFRALICIQSNVPPQKHHQFINTVGWAAEYAHPLESILGNHVPFVVGPFLVHASFQLWMIWMVRCLRCSLLATLIHVTHVSSSASGRPLTRTRVMLCRSRPGTCCPATTPAATTFITATTWALTAPSSVFARPHRLITSRRVTPLADLGLAVRHGPAVCRVACQDAAAHRINDMSTERLIERYHHIHTNNNAL